MADRLESGQIQICRRPDSFCPDFQFASANKTRVFEAILQPDRIRTYPDSGHVNEFYCILIDWLLKTLGH